MLGQLPVKDRYESPTVLHARGRMSLFHGGNTGSSPVGRANKIKGLGVFVINLLAATKMRYQIIGTSTPHAEASIEATNEG